MKFDIWVEINGGWEVQGTFGRARIAPDTAATLHPHSSGRLRVVAYGALAEADCTAEATWWPHYHSQDDLRRLMLRALGGVQGVIAWDDERPRLILTSAWHTASGSWRFEYLDLRERPFKFQPGPLGKYL